MLSLNNVGVSYSGTPALRKISISIEPGSFVGLFGHNGSGKSTLLRVLSGLEPSTHGTIESNGVMVSPVELAAMTVFVQDEPALYDYLSVRENLSFAAAIWGGKLSSAVTRLRALGVEINLDTLAKNLSLGTRKKLWLVITGMKQANWILLDEPFNALDRDSVELVALRLAEAKKAGVGIILTAHDPSPVRHLLDRELTLVQGQIASVLSINGQSGASGSRTK